MATPVMKHPFFDALRYPWDRADAQTAYVALYEAVSRFKAIETLYRKCKGGLPPLAEGAANDVWSEALDKLAAARALEALCTHVLADPGLEQIHPQIRAIRDAERVEEKGVPPGLPWWRRYWRHMVIACAVLAVGSGGVIGVRACMSSVTISVDVHVTSEQAKVLKSPDTVIELRSEELVARSTSVVGDGDVLTITFEVPRSALGERARLRVRGNGAPVFVADFEITDGGKISLESVRSGVGPGSNEKPPPADPSVTITQPTNDTRVRPGFVVEVRIAPADAATEVEIAIGEKKVTVRVEDGVATVVAPSLRPSTYKIGAIITRGSGKGTRAAKHVTVVLEDDHPVPTVCCYVAGGVGSGAACACPTGKQQVPFTKPHSSPGYCGRWTTCR